MVNYLALIRKADFIDLYKYGKFHINKDMIQSFSCEVENLSQEKQIFDEIIKQANNFDSSFTYLFIHYEKEDGDIADIKITDLRNIYPLDQEAKLEFSISFDSRIKIQDPLWPDEFFNWQKKQSVNNCKRGVENVWRIYGIEEPIEDIKKIITDEILKELTDEIYENLRPSKKSSIWIYIMRYERHAPYPNNTKGAFMDATNVILNYMSGKENDYYEIESTFIMQHLKDCKYDNFESIIDGLPKDSKFWEFSRNIEPDLDLIKIATLFYVFKNRYAGHFIYDKEWVDQGKKYSREFAIACYMLGCILGYDYTYDCLYEQLPLPIFGKNNNKGNRDKASKQRNTLPKNQEVKQQTRKESNKKRGKGNGQRQNRSDSQYAFDF